MGYLGSQATFTGTQNHKRVSKTAAQGQKDFTVDGGYDIGAIDVFRNGIRLVGQRDFSALDGVTVTLVEGANLDDILEFVTFVNFQVDDVVTRDGDSVIKGNLTVSGDLGITGSLNATVSNTATAGFSSVSGISTQVSGFLGVGVTGTNLNVTGVITANSFSGDGSGLTGIAATDDVSTNGLVVAGISTLAGATFSGVSTFQDKVHLLDNDRLHFGGASGDTGDLEIYHNGSTISYIDSKSTQLRIETDAIRLRTDGGETYLEGDANAAVKIYYNNSKKFETAPTGVVITGITTADGFRAGDDDKIVLGTGDDLEIFHDGTHSRIKDVRDSGTLRIQADNFKLIDKDAGETMISAVVDGAVELYHDNTKRLETASGGINVGTGITMDGNGIAVAGILTANGVTVGQNAIGARTVQSGGSPSGGSNGDIYYIY